MYENVTTEFNNLAFGLSREVTAKVEINGTTYQDEIVSFKLSEAVASEQALAIGETCASQLDMTLQFNPEMNLTGAKLLPFVSFDSEEWCPLGAFWVSTVETPDNYITVDITAYDQMAFLNETYDGTATTCAGVMEYLSTKYSFVVCETEYPAAEVITEIECTCREMIGYIAGLCGKNARFNRDGQLEFVWFTQIKTAYGDVNVDNIVDSNDISYICSNLYGSASTTAAEAVLGRLIVGKAYIGAQIKDAAKSKLADVNTDGIVDNLDINEIQAYIDGDPYKNTSVGEVSDYAQAVTDDEIYLDGLTQKNKYTVSCLISGMDDAAIISGNGRAITFANPFITQGILDKIASEILPFEYTVAEVQYRGNPAYECGDIIRVNGLNVPIMTQEFEFDGGLMATIFSYGLSDEEIKMTIKTDNVNRKISAIEEVLEDINNSLLSGTDGYLILDEEEIDGIKRLSGFKLMNTPSVTEITKGWMANKNGIGWSSDGFKTISKLGLDMANGKIYADQIAAGSVITNSFKIGDAMSFDGTTGKITFGAGVSMGWDNIEDVPNDLAYTDDIPDATTITYITQNAIQTGDLHLGGKIYQIVEGKYWWESEEHLLFGVNSSKNLQVGSPSKIVEYENLNLYAYENIYLVPDGRTVESGDWTMVVRGPNADSGQGVSVHGNLSATGTIYQNGSSLMTRSDTKTLVESYGYYESGDNIYANRLYVQGAGTISGDPNARLAVSSPYQLGYSSGSSREFKHDIRAVINEELDPHHLYDIEVVQFKYNEDYLDPNDQRYMTDCIGFIAEQVNEVYPIAADRETGEPRNWEMRYIIPPMLYLIQEQKKEIDELKRKVGIE